MGVRYFALAAGIVYLLIGIMGLLGIGLVPITASGGLDPALAVDGQYGRLLGIFPVNILHNIVHLAVGAWGIVSYRSFTGSKVFARGLAIFYGLLTIMGLLPFTNTTFGLIPIYGNDVWLHALTALIAAYFGFVPSATRTEYVDASRRR